LAQEDGFGEMLTYRVEDLNALALEPESADMVVAIGALHHLTNLEHICAQIYRALRPGGVLIASEYIGPNHQQLTPRQVELINAIIHLLPHDRRERFEYNFTSHRFWPFRLARLGIRQLAGIDPYPTVSRVRKMIYDLSPFRRYAFGKVFDYRPRPYWMMTDPSEGVRAAEIIPQLHQYFAQMDIYPYNGSILLHALDPHYLATYNPDDPLHGEWIHLLCDLERRLIALGELPSDNAFIVARKA
jgi:SAM-dependent methyltransferase